MPVPKGTKLTVCGDVHGQYFDLLNIFDINGLPSQDNPYLFNGQFCAALYAWLLDCPLASHNTAYTSQDLKLNFAPPETAQQTAYDCLCVSLTSTLAFDDKLSEAFPGSIIWHVNCSR